MVERAAGAVALLDAGCRILHLNRAMRAFVDRRDGLMVAAGRLAAAEAPARARFEALIAQAASADPARRSGAVTALGGPNRRRPLSVTIAPFRSERHAVHGRGPSVIVCVTDLDAAVSVADERLKALFDLSPAELRVAHALFEGLSPREAAESLGVSFFTVRGHLARIREKTDTRGQTDLARLMMRLAEPERGRE